MTKLEPRSLFRNLLIAGALAIALSADAQTITQGRLAQKLVERIEKISFSKSFEVTGPGGARDYVGLWPLDAPLDDPAAVRRARLAWKYLDNRNDAAAVAERRTASAGPTSGKVVFDDLVPGKYELRLYINGSSESSDMIMRAPFEVGPRVLELLHYGDATVTVQRSSLTGVDKVDVQFSDGRVSEIYLDPSIQLTTRRVGLPEVNP